ncbi:amidohydrolase family protein [Sphingomonas sp. HITSZ_GF]|uniref:amidohydrolase family protein n=1 Tax=Sphingomonas sp. HITSZ_GF TaxID=3037247 RepID=UPI00240DB9B9|nr:amidohydrolase family protein [Sphingomonas sp. HITSZ_GF]MDG2534422.1 amidohydrolase family protein [Sphingomonas sp. HITSZ_GF]
MAASLLAGSMLALAAPALANDVVIHAGTLIDGVSRTPRTKVSIIIKDDRIVAIEAGFVTPEGAEVIDLSAETVLPGFIDCHDHITGGNARRDLLRGTPEKQVYEAMVNLRATLRAGFTTIRDVGGNVDVLRALKDGLRVGQVVGPRMWVAGFSIVPTGGHGDIYNSIDSTWKRTDDLLTLPVISGKYEARKAVREMQKRGADLIKITVTGGVASHNTDVNIQTMNDEEITSVVDTAHMLGLKVAAHAHGKPGIDAAIRDGVDSIEHGTYSDAETYKLMKAHGTFMVPTLFAGFEIAEETRKNPDKFAPDVVWKAQHVTPTMSSNAYNAWKAGVKIALGTDQLGYRPHGSNAFEFQYMVEAGIPAMDAIMAGTSSAAELIGVPQDIGSVQAGRFADIVAVKGDPLKDIKVLQSVDFVMKGGAVFKRDGRMVVPK